MHVSGALLERLEQVVYPPLCSCCRARMPLRVPLCHDCHISSRRILPLSYKHKGVHVDVYALGAYEGAVQKLVRAKNYGQVYGAHAIAQLLTAEHLDKITGARCIMPVPLHWSRKLWRGFNQSEIIAQHLSKKSGIPVHTPIKRMRATPQLTRLSIKERNSLMRGVFGVPGSSRFSVMIYRNTHVVIVDDVYTTGTTIKEMIDVLKKMGIVRVSVLVAARVI